MKYRKSAPVRCEKIMNSRMDFLFSIPVALAPLKHRKFPWFLQPLSSIFVKNTHKIFALLWLALSLSVTIVATPANAQTSSSTENPIWKEDHAEEAAAWYENYINPTHIANFDSVCAVGFEAQRAMDNRPAMKVLSSTAWNMVATSDDGNVSGRGSCIAFDKNGPIYYGTTKGGLWKTTDNGTSWTSLSDTWKDLDVGAVAVDPTNSLTVYAGTGTPAGGVGGGGDVNGVGVYKSTDGGVNWTLLPGSPQRATTQMEVNPASPNIVYYASTSGVSISDDHGATWKTSLSIGGYTSIVIDPHNPSILFAAGGGVVRKSLDSGKSWTILPSGYPTGYQMILGMSNVSSDTIYLSTGDGSTNSTTGSTLALSTNAGQTWTVKSNNKNYLGQQAGYANAMAVNPTNPSVVVAGGLDIYTSSIGGASLHQVTDWQTSSGSGNYTHADIHVLKYNPYTNVLYTMTDGGLYHSASNGSSWQSNMNKTLGTFAFIGGDMSATASGGPDFFAAGAQDNGLSAFTYGVDPTWRSVRGGDGGTMFVAPKDGQTCFGTYIYATLYKSDDRGLDWIAGGADQNDPANILGTGILNDQMPFYMIYDVWDGDPSVVACLSYTNLYLETTGNVGPSAFPQATNTSSSNTISGNPSAVNIASADDTYMYLGTSSGLYHSEDMGQSWTKSTTAVGEPYAITTDPNDATHVFMTTSNGKHFCISTDNGQTWKFTTNNLPNLTYTCVAVDNNGILYVGNNYGVLRSGDQGVTWYPVASGFPTDLVTSLHVRGNCLAATTYGRGMYWVDLTQLPPIGASGIVSSSSANSGVAITSVYPSIVTSAAPHANIDYSVTNDGQASLAVFDVLGREERMLVKDWLTKGNHETAADLSGIAAGQHYLVLICNGSSVTKPFVIQ
jgi:hypothetical protein